MKKTNKWQFWFRPFSRDYRKDPIGWHLFDMGLIKLHTFPENGTMISRKHYYGFIIRFNVKSNTPPS